MNEVIGELNTVDDFLVCAAFFRWVKEKRPEDRLVWQRWLMQHPDKRNIYEQAVATLLVIQGQVVDPIASDEQAKRQADKILAQLTAQEVRIRPVWYWGRWVAAASVLIGLSFWWKFDKTVNAPISVAFQHSEQLPASEWKAVRNRTGQSLVVLLPDRSSVLLSSGGLLRFRKQDDQPLREVYLQGEAFFEVTPNPARPFLVYSPILTTKVVGTSFQVKSFDKVTPGSVLVKTGRVVVSPVLTPGRSIQLSVREKLIFTPSTGEILKQQGTAMHQPSAIVDQQFVYNYTAVSTIFDQLETAYHMPIRYDRTLLKSCTFTGQLTGVAFLEKIRLVCLTIDSTFEVIDGQVIIKSRGCL